MPDEQYETELPADVEQDLDAAETAESNDEDVDVALERETDDGKGGAVVPKGDFDSFATDDVETEDEPDTQES